MDSPRSLQPHTKPKTDAYASSTDDRSRGQLRVVASALEENLIIESHINKLAAGKESLEILEAGCGRKWPLTLDGVKFTLTGIDMDDKALAARKNELRDLHIAIHGDLRSAQLDRAYDVIYCSFVLEHIQGVDRVLNNFKSWLADDGLLIIRVPDYDSVYGFFARNTPFWFHVAYKRYVEARPNAGKPGFPPYPTFYEKNIALRELTGFCILSGLEPMEILGVQTRVSPYGVVNRLYGFFGLVMQAVTFGKLRGDHANLTLIAQNKSAD